MKLPDHDTFRAIALAFSAFFLFSIVDVFAKWTGIHYGTHVSLSVCGVAGLAMMIPFILYHKGWGGFIPRRLVRPHILRTAVTTANGILIFTALQHIPLADYYGIVFATPFVTAIASIFFFGERVGRHRWSAIATGFLGIWVIVAPSYHEFNIGTAAALCVPLTLAVNAVLMRKIGRDEYPPLLAFFPFIGMVVFNAPMAVVTGAALPPVGELWLFVPYAAVVVVAIMLLGRAYAVAPVMASIAPLQYTSMLWGCLFGSFFFDNAVTWNTWAGAAIVIVAGLYLLHRERVHARAQSLQTAT